jgi:hypothetical protein
MVRGSAFACSPERRNMYEAEDPPLPGGLCFCLEEDYFLRASGFLADAFFAVDFFAAAFFGAAFGAAFFAGAAFFGAAFLVAVFLAAAFFGAAFFAPDFFAVAFFAAATRLAGRLLPVLPAVRLPFFVFISPFPIFWSVKGLAKSIWRVIRGTLL